MLKLLLIGIALSFNCLVSPLTETYEKLVEGLQVTQDCFQQNKQALSDAKELSRHSYDNFFKAPLEAFKCLVSLLKVAEKVQDYPSHIKDHNQLNYFEKRYNHRLDILTKRVYTFLIKHPADDFISMLKNKDFAGTSIIGIDEFQELPILKKIVRGCVEMSSITGSNLEPNDKVIIDQDFCDFIKNIFLIQKKQAPQKQSNFLTFKLAEIAYIQLARYTLKIENKSLETNISSEYLIKKDLLKTLEIKRDLLNKEPSVNKYEISTINKKILLLNEWLISNNPSQNAELEKQNLEKIEQNLMKIKRLEARYSSIMNIPGAYVSEALDQAGKINLNGYIRNAKRQSRK